MTTETDGVSPRFLDFFDDELNGRAASRKELCSTRLEREGNLRSQCLEKNGVKRLN